MIMVTNNIIQKIRERYTGNGVDLPLCFHPSIMSP